MDEAEALGLVAPAGSMVLVSRSERAVLMRIKARMAPFHNFILERCGALKLERPAKSDLSGWRCVGMTSGKRWGGEIPHFVLVARIGDDRLRSPCDSYIHVLIEENRRTSR